MYTLLCIVYSIELTYTTCIVCYIMCTTFKYIPHKMYHIRFEYDLLCNTVLHPQDIPYLDNYRPPHRLRLRGHRLHRLHRLYRLGCPLGHVPRKGHGTRCVDGDPSEWYFGAKTVTGIQDHSGIQNSVTSKHALWLKACDLNGFDQQASHFKQHKWEVEQQN